MGVGNGQEVRATTNPVGNAGSASRGLIARERSAPAPESNLRIIETAFLRSGTGSRSQSHAASDEAMSELVASIDALGIIEPIVVRQEARNFVVVAGERRFAAAKLLRLRQLPCVVTHCSDSESLVISLTENLQRSDLNPVDKASALRRLLDEFGLTQQEIGRRVGMSQSAIAHHLRLLSLPQEVRRMINDGALSVGHGKVLAGIEDEDEAIDAAKDCVSNNMSVREFEASVSIARGKSEKRLPRGTVRNSREERELRNGLFLVIKESREERGSGTIEIPFHSLDERNWVLKALSEQGTKRATPPAPAQLSSPLRAQSRPLTTQPSQRRESF